MKRRRFLASLALSPILVQDTFANDSDVYLSVQEYGALTSLNLRLKRVKKFVGFGHFNIISYDDALMYARNYSAIGRFTMAEKKLLEKLFFEDPTKYGFFGQETCQKIDNIITQDEVIKIPYTGHYLFKGQPLYDYKKLKKDIGETLVLTSGVRNTIKQMSLYVNKIYNCGGNMTQATLSIAPPRFSYHTISDFDVGRKGWGYKNFTADFATTSEFKKMIGLDYIGVRYTHNNDDGVRFEPWHVEVI